MPFDFRVSDPIVQELKKALPPNLSASSSFEEDLARLAEYRNQGLLSQRLLLQHLLQTLGPNRVVFYPTEGRSPFNMVSSVYHCSDAGASLQPHSQSLLISNLCAEKHNSKGCALCTEHKLCQAIESYSVQASGFLLIQLQTWVSCGFGPDASEQEQEEGTSLESQVVMAGPRLAAALEFLSVRPVGEVAAVVPGAAEVQDLSELLVREETATEQADELGDDTEVSPEGQEGEAQGGDEDGAEEQTDTNGEDRDDGSSGADTQPDDSATLTVPPSKYRMADDLWGESLLELLESQSGSTAAGNAAASESTSSAPETDEEETEEVEQQTTSASEELSQAMNQLLQRRWTAWGPYCPVSLKEEGKAVEGQKQFAVEFAGKLFLIADEEKLNKFIKDPKKYVDAPPSLPRTTNIYLFGPSYAGAAKQARLLSRTYGLIALDVGKEIAEGHRRKEEENQRQLEEEERRKEERLLQEELKKQQLREEEERRLMLAEDDPERLAAAISGGLEEGSEPANPPVAEGSTQGSAGITQLSPSTGTSGSNSGRANTANLMDSNREEVQIEPADATTEQNEGTNEVLFMTTDEEEELLKKGHALGKRRNVETHIQQHCIVFPLN